VTVSRCYGPLVGEEVGPLLDQGEGDLRLAALRPAGDEGCPAGLINRRGVHSDRVAAVQGVVQHRSSDVRPARGGRQPGLQCDIELRLVETGDGRPMRAEARQQPAVTVARGGASVLRRSSQLRQLLWPDRRNARQRDVGSRRRRGRTEWVEEVRDGIDLRELHPARCHHETSGEVPGAILHRRHSCTIWSGAVRR
jgi:hypothetical protein